MKQFTGTVTSTKMDKTIVVEVTRQWVHPKYRKIVKRTKKYQVHDETNNHQVGDQVNFVETKPISKNKRFTVINPKK
jgi:small subunit ribosomal protein S17